MKPPNRRDFLPLRIMAITLGAIFLAELIAMIVIYLIPIESYILVTLIDAMIMLVLIFPLVYFLIYRSLLENITHLKHVENALWESNDFLERIFSLTHILIAYMDLDFNIIRVNRAYASSDDRDPDFYIGKNHFDLFPNTENEAIFRQVVQTGQPYSVYAKSFEYADNPERGISYWDWSLIPTKTEHGELNGLLLSLIDVTARKKTELALVEAEQRFKAIFDQAFQFNALIAPDGTLIEINQTTLEFVDLERSKVIGLPVWEAFAKNFDRPMKHRMQEVFQLASQGEVVRFEGEMSGRQSKVIYIDYSLKPFKNQQGQITLIIAEGRDITSRKQMESALELEQQRLYALLDRLPAFVALQSPDHKIRFANNQFRQRFGEPDGKNCYQIMMGYHSPCPDCHIPEVLATNTPQMWEKTYTDGKSFQIYGYPFSDIDHTSAVLELGVDITENKLAQAKIQQQADRTVALADILRSILEVGSDYQAVLDRITCSVVSLIGDGCVIRLISNDRQTHKTAYFHHADPQILDELAEAMVTDIQPFEAGITDHVLQSGQPLSLNTMELDQVETINGIKHPTYWVGHSIYSLLCVPLQTREELFGTLTLFRDLNQQPYVEEDYLFVQNLVDQAALAMHNARLFEAEFSARITAEILRDASLSLTQTLDLETVLELFLDYANQLTPYEWARVYLIEDEANLSLRAQRGFADIKSIPLSKFDPEQSPVINELMTAQKSVLIPDTRLHPFSQRANINSRNARSWIGIPLIAESNVIGVCVFEKSDPFMFSDQHVQLLEALIAQVTVIIQNSWFFKQVCSGRERMQSLSRKLVEIQESERRYISRELHDEASQALSSLIVGLRLIEREAGNPESVLAGTEELKTIAEGVISNLHRLAMDLRPASLDFLGLVAALRQHAEAISDRYHLTVQFEAIDINDRLPPDTETAIYRIVQEALSNVILHANATRVDILFEKRDGNLIVIVEDNGIGFDPLAAIETGRLGLVGMQERADMLGGRLTVESQPGVGTTLFLEAPYGN